VYIGINNFYTRDLKQFLPASNFLMILNVNQLIYGKEGAESEMW